MYDADQDRGAGDDGVREGGADSDSDSDSVLT